MTTLNCDSCAGEIGTISAAEREVLTSLELKRGLKFNVACDACLRKLMYDTKGKLEMPRFKKATKRGGGAPWNKGRKTMQCRARTTMGKRCLSETSQEFCRVHRGQRVGTAAKAQGQLFTSRRRATPKRCRGCHKFVGRGARNCKSCGMAC